jgi:flagellar protein FlgJ
VIRDPNLLTMASPLSSQRLTQTATDLAADSRSLDALKREARNDPKAAAKKAATQFEALFMQMVLKSMRDATPKSGLLGGDSGHETYTAMLDQQLATRMAAGGTGLADTIARQLTRHLDAGPEARGASQEGRRLDAGREARGASQETRRPDRYAELAKINPMSAVRDAELARRNDAVRAAYLNRTELPADAPAAAPVQSSEKADALAQARRGFVLRHWDQALAAERATGVPARFIISQAALESGWGKHEIKQADGLPSHNLFGIKAGGGWKGRTVDVVTTEYKNGAAKKVVEKFRAYTNTTEAFRDWAQLMKSNPRYAQVLRQGQSGSGFAFGLQQAGYATDPNYAEKLAKVIDAVSAVRA